mmetsp:Transcript_15606/g.47180  ORF Transcript_15606/g.47180 Transcript_15606/m.47180 type:complete len:222 (-) Transcript_15606:22-687(-)
MSPSGCLFPVERRCSRVSSTKRKYECLSSEHATATQTERTRTLRRQGGEPTTRRRRRRSCFLSRRKTHARANKLFPTTTTTRLEGVLGEVDVVFFGGLGEAVLGDGLQGFGGHAHAHEAVALVPPELAGLEVHLLDLVVADVRERHRPRLGVAPLPRQVAPPELHRHQPPRRLSSRRLHLDAVAERRGEDQGVGRRQGREQNQAARHGRRRRQTHLVVVVC